MVWRPATTGCAMREALGFLGFIAAQAALFGWAMYLSA